MNKVAYRHPTPKLSGVALLFLALFVLSSFLWADTARAQETDSDDFVDGEIVVKLNLQQLGPSPDCKGTIEDLRRRHSATVEDKLLENPSVACIYLLQLPQGSSTEDVAGAIAGDTRVVYAEPNFTTDAPEGSFRHRARSDSVPTPSSESAPYSSQYAVGALKLNEAHSVTKGDAGTAVAVLDTGAQLDHPELTGSLVLGYDFADDDSNPADEPNTLDDDGDGETDETTGHGTHVAGIVHLTVPDAKIMPLRVLDSDGTGNIFVIAEAVQYAVNNGVDVINMSLGSSRESKLVSDVLDDLRSDDDDGESDALENVPTEGIFVAASAGNEGGEALQYPAAEEGVTAVASVGEDERKSDFSSYGSSWVDVAAPGDDIHSTFPTSRYAQWDGTSMAAPFVAGQAALIRGLDPCYDAVKVEDRILATARSVDDKNPEYAGKLGKGHADAGASVRGFQPENRDCTRPETTITSGPSGTTADPTPTFAFAGSDAVTTSDNLEFSYKVDNGPWSDYSSAKNITLGPLDEGSHTFYVKARDGEKNVDSSPATRSFTVDTTPPSDMAPSDTIPPNTAISSGPPGTTRSTSAGFGFYASEATQRFECSLNYAAFAPCTSPKSYSGLASRTHAFRVRAVDRAGNVDATPSVRTWTVDALRPTLSSLSPAAGSRTRDRTPVIRVTARDSQTNLAKGNVALYVDGGRKSNFSYNQATDRLMYTSGSLSYGWHTVKVVARDSAGNVSSRTWRFTVSR